uniref:Uncharacterized protein n=1 Tax=Anguilla anguilla TaxID=7936 RepID=A0A0E9SQ37_ANGAN
MYVDFSIWRETFLQSLSGYGYAGPPDGGYSATPNPSGLLRLSRLPNIKPVLYARRGPCWHACSGE